MEKATGCTASAGIGPNMLVARLATKKAKPNGAFRIRASESEAAITALPLADLPGVGWCGPLAYMMRLTGTIGLTLGISLFRPDGYAAALDKSV